MFRISDSASKPVAFYRGKSLHYMAISPLGFGRNYAQRLVPLYLEYRSTQWNDEGLNIYFDGNITQEKPPWTERFLVDTEPNSTLEDVRFYAPDIHTPDAEPLRNTWTLYFSLYNLRSKRMCIGRATVNLTDSEVDLLPEYGPRDWTSDPGPVMCSYASNVVRKFNSSVFDIELNKTVHVVREIVNPEAEMDDGFKHNLLKLVPEYDRWEPNTREPAAFPPAALAWDPECAATDPPTPAPTSTSGGALVGTARDESCYRLHGDAMEPSVFSGHNGSLWMVYGSFKLSHTQTQRGLWVVQLNPETGRLYNESTKPWETAGNFSVRPQLLHPGRGNASISSANIFRSPRSAETNQTWYFLVYSEAMPANGDEETFRIPEETSPQLLPVPNRNFTLSLRVARALYPWGPYYDREGHHTGHPFCCTLIMNQSLVDNIELISRDHIYQNGIFRRMSDYQWIRRGYDHLFDQHGGLVRQGAVGFMPFCEAAHPAINKVLAASGDYEYVFSFTYKPCHILFAGPFYAAYQVNFGSIFNYSFEDPWPQLSGGVWDPYRYSPPPIIPFPTALVVGLIVGFVCGTLYSIRLYFKWKAFKQAQIHPGTIVVLKHPWYRCCSDMVAMMCNDCTYRWCGQIWCTTMTRTEMLVSRYSDPLGEVKLAMDNYEVPDGQRLLWLQTWDRLDQDGDNSMNIPEFLKLIEAEDNLWTRRVFETYNKDFNGSVRLRDLVDVSFCDLVYDRTKTYEFAFRLLSRRGVTFDPNTDVLDKTDIFYFVASRYPEMTQEQHHLLALSIFSFIDDDGSGGIAYQEFLGFCRTNRSFVLWGYRWQEKTRQAIMGRKFWHKQTKERQDLFVYDKKFFDRMDQELKDDDPPWKFREDFPEVYLSQVEKKNHKLLQKKIKLAQAGDASSRAFRVMVDAVNRIEDNMGSLSIKSAFRKIKKFARAREKAQVEAQLHSDFSLHKKIVQDQERFKPTGGEVLSSFAESYLANLHQVPDLPDARQDRFDEVDVFLSHI